MQSVDLRGISGGILIKSIFNSAVYAKPSASGPRDSREAEERDE